MLGIRPEDVSLNPSGKLSGEIALSEPLGVETIVHIKYRNRRNYLPGSRSGAIETMATQVRFDINLNQLHFFDEQGNRI